MAYHRFPPKLYVLKIKIYGIFTNFSRPNTNDSRIGVIYKNSEGNLKLLAVWTIPSLTQLGNQLWAVFIALVRAYFEGYCYMELEIDNYEA